MTTPYDVPLVKKGDPPFFAEHQNVLTMAARKDYSFRRGFTNRGGQQSSKDIASVDRWEYAKAQQNIPAFSVFTITYGTTYSKIVPTSLIKQVTVGEPYNVIATNDDWGLAAGQSYYVALIGFEEPKLVNYDPQDGVPTVDDVVGPKPGTYKVSKKEKGLVAVSPPDTTNEQIWVIRDIPGDPDPVSIKMFEFIEELYPGYTAKARKLRWDTVTTTYIIDVNDTTEYILFDPEEQNFFIRTERVHAIEKKLFDDQAVKFCDYEIIGEHGLRRKTQVQGDVECGQVGTSIVHTGASKVHPPPKDPASPTCGITASLAQLKVCNQYGYRRKIINEEIATVDWDHGRQAWVYEQEDRAVLVEATLGQDMCPDDLIASVSGATLMDWLANGCSTAPIPDITQATNSKSLAGKSGDTVFIRHYEGRTGADEWHISEVKHKKRYVLRYFDDAAQGCLQLKKLEISLMTCKDDESDAFGTQIRVLSDIRKNYSSDCELALDFLDVCVLSLEGAGSRSWPLIKTPALVGFQWESDSQTEQCTLKPLITEICAFGATASVIGPGGIDFNYVSVGTSIVENGNCVELGKKKIPIPQCPIIDDTNETIFCVVDCEETPSAVLPEATSNPGTPYTPTNKQTQPYDPSGTTLATDITIKFPSGAVEGEIIAVANNTDSDKPITIDGNGNNVQAITAPYTAATVEVWGARLSITYQLRLVGTGPSMAWRII